MKLLPRFPHRCAAPALLCSLLAAMSALSLGACRGLPQQFAFAPPAPPAPPPFAAPEDAADVAPVVSATEMQRTLTPVVTNQPQSAYDTQPPLSPESIAFPQQADSDHGYRSAEAPPVTSGRAPSPALSRQTVSPQTLPRQAPQPRIQPVSHTEPSGAEIERTSAVEFTPSVARVGHTARTLPPSAFTGQQHCCGADPAYPPEVWYMRRDEFLCDGGDRELEVQVNPDWTIRGLDQEDTVVHFDTIDGATEVEPSNCVCIYAPRFAAVRKTVGLSLARLRQKSAGVDLPMMLVQQEDVDAAGTVNQPLQPGRNVGLEPLVTLEDRNKGVMLENRNLALGLDNGFLPYENLLLIRRGQFDNSEKARLANSIEAAAVWSEEQAVQVVVDGEEAVVQEGVVEPLEIDRVERQGKPRMRICKVASDKDARPGDIIHFTLRFDNIGDQVVGNVTIVDHLVTRLEYVPDSAECSLDAQFFATEVEGESLVLRWEIAEPIEPGHGGIIRFQCRVR